MIVIDLRLKNIYECKISYDKISFKCTVVESSSFLFYILVILFNNIIALKLITK